MAWIYLVLAGVLEVVWAYSMKLSEGFTKPMPTVVTIVGMKAKELKFCNFEENARSDESVIKVALSVNKENVVSTYMED